MTLSDRLEMIDRILGNARDIGAFGGTLGKLYLFGYVYGDMSIKELVDSLREILNDVTDAEIQAMMDETETDREYIFKERE